MSFFVSDQLKDSIDEETFLKINEIEDLHLCIDIDNYRIPVRSVIFQSTYDKLICEIATPLMLKLLLSNKNSNITTRLFCNNVEVVQWNKPLKIESIVKDEGQEKSLIFCEILICKD